MVKNLQNNKPQTDLDPSKAWIRNLGIGLTKKMPKNRWKLEKTSITVNKTKYKSGKMTKRPAYLPNLLYDSIGTIYCMNARSDPHKLSNKSPTLKRVLNNYYDGSVTNFPHECDINIMNPVSKDIQPSRPQELSMNLASFDFSSLSSSNLYDIKLNDSPSSLPLDSTEQFTNNFPQIDKASHDLCHIRLIKSKCVSKVKRICFNFFL